MKFIVNTTIVPHFCALFSAEDELVSVDFWENNRKDSDMIFDFVSKNIEANTKISFIGGVSGPGGFSSLRVASGVLTAFSIKYDIGIHSVLAEEWLSKITDASFFMPSFGKNVWLVCNGKRKLVDLELCWSENREIECKYLLSKQQKKILSESLAVCDFSTEELLHLLRLLQTKKSHNQFVPEYAMPPVS